MTELKRLRTDKGMTQQEAAERIGVSLRSYVSYENDETKKESTKYRFLISEIEKINPIDEEHGILSKEDIIKICNRVFSEYEVEYCYLFGSYAKGKATGSSDVDLLISSKITGLKFYELVEKLREELHKKVDLLDFRQLLGNEKLLNEVLKEGIRIYG
ncbi:MAG: nucleotidyltransferase domain-containing protein [Erysipelotrichaceae bacterium]|nr:nucleotidyltransferase domain-containing protein [Erysipelotrichaceae bacterium]